MLTISELTISEDLGAKIWEWKKLNDKLAAYKAQEMKLRKSLVQELCPNPVEGVNTYNLPADWKIKITCKMNRKLDEAALPAVIEELGTWVEDKVINRKPTLNYTAYKTLPDDVRSVFDEALIETVGAPSMTLIEPKVLPED